MVLTPLMVKILLSTLSFLGGSLLSLAISYVIFSRDLAYIKGQLASLLKLGEKLDDTNRSVAILEKEHVQTRTDLNHAHGKIRDIQKAG